jgi:ketosteroid isomerase-like protein
MDVDELFDGWERAWSGRDPAAFADVCVPAVHYEDPLTSEPLTSVQAVGDRAQRLWAAAPDARVNSTGTRVHTGAFVAAPCRILGTHTGPLGRIAPTGRALDVHAVVYAELDPDGGRMLRVRAFFDVYRAAMALGVLPRHGTAGERAMLMLRGFGLRG